MRFSFRWIKNVADIETIRAIMYVSLDDQVKHSYFFLFIELSERFLG